MPNKTIKSILCFLLLFLSFSVMARDDAGQLSKNYEVAGKVDHVNFSQSSIVIGDIVYHLSPDFILVQAVGNGQQRVNPSSLKKGQWIGFNTIEGKMESIRLINKAIVLAGKPDDNSSDD